MVTQRDSGYTHKCCPSRKLEWSSRERDSGYTQVLPPQGGWSGHLDRDRKLYGSLKELHANVPYILASQCLAEKERKIMGVWYLVEILQPVVVGLELCFKSLVFLQLGRDVGQVTV